MSKHYLLTLSLECSTSVPAYCLFSGNNDTEAQLANIITTAAFIDSKYDTEDNVFIISNYTDTIAPYEYKEISAEHKDIIRSTLFLREYNGLAELVTDEFSYEDVEQYITVNEPDLLPLFAANFANEDTTMCTQLAITTAESHQRALEHVDQFTFLTIKDKTTLTLTASMKELAVNCLWGSLSSIEINTDNEIISDWLTFKAGTNRLDIWKWFETTFDMNVKSLSSGGHNTNFVHNRCHQTVSFDSISKGYIAVCEHCEEDLFSFEVSKRITQ